MLNKTKSMLGVLLVTALLCGCGEASIEQGNGVGLTEETIEQGNSEGLNEETSM